MFASHNKIVKGDQIWFQKNFHKKYSPHFLDSHIFSCEEKRLSICAAHGRVGMKPNSFPF